MLSPCLCKIASRKVDFDDLVLMALQLLDRNAAIASVVSDAVHHLLVDEFQVCVACLVLLFPIRRPHSISFRGAHGGTLSTR